MRALALMVSAGLVGMASGNCSVEQSDPANSEKLGECYLEGAVAKYTAFNSGNCTEGYKLFEANYKCAVELECPTLLGRLLGQCGSYGFVLDTSQPGVQVCNDIDANFEKCSEAGEKVLGSMGLSESELDAYSPSVDVSACQAKCDQVAGELAADITIALVSGKDYSCGTFTEKTQEYQLCYAECHQGNEFMDGLYMGICDVFKSLAGLQAVGDLCPGACNLNAEQIRASLETTEEPDNGCSRNNLQVAVFTTLFIFNFLLF